MWVGRQGNRGRPIPVVPEDFDDHLIPQAGQIVPSHRQIPAAVVLGQVAVAPPSMGPMLRAPGGSLISSDPIPQALHAGHRPGIAVDDESDRMTGL